MADAHVVPLRDQVAHHVPGVDLDQHGTTGPWLVVTADPDDGQRCVCAPTVEHVPNDDGPDGWMHVHHSLDGRERHEPDREVTA